MSTRGPASKNVRVCAVKTCPLDPAELAERFRRAALARGFREEVLCDVAGVRLAAYTRRVSGPRPRLYISTGVHGDEPAPPHALLGLLEADLFDDRAVWFLVPLLNPAGFQHNRRENAAGIDLNRDYLHPASPEVAAHIAWLERQPRFDAALCLHEDWESAGLYLYELNTSGGRGFARELRTAGEAVIAIDPATVIDGRAIDEPGIIRPESDPALRQTWPEAIYLRRHHTELCYTIETPSGHEPAARIAAHQAMVRRAVAMICDGA